MLWTSLGRQVTSTCFDRDRWQDDKIMWNCQAAPSFHRDVCYLSTATAGLFLAVRHLWKRPLSP